MPARKLYVFWSNAHQAYHVKGAHQYSPHVNEAARLTEGAALDAIVQFALESDPNKGYVLMVAPESRD